MGVNDKLRDILLLTLTAAGPAAAAFDLRAVQKLAGPDWAVSVQEAAEKLASAPEIGPAAFSPAPAPGLWRRPFHCPNRPVVYVKDGVLYRGEEVLGTHPQSFKEACSGDVAWLDAYERLRKNQEILGAYPAFFDISQYNGVVLWKDPGGHLYKDREHIGIARWFSFVSFTGDVVWIDSYGGLYKNQLSLGSGASGLLAVADYTGDVAWVDSFGVLYKNKETLGKSSQFLIAAASGDVAWVDRYGNLYKNNTWVASKADFMTFRLDPNGRLVWTDAFRREHSL